MPFVGTAEFVGYDKALLTDFLERIWLEINSKGYLGFEQALGVSDRQRLLSQHQHKYMSHKA